MLNKLIVESEEESIRQQVAEMPTHLRSQFYKQVEGQLKDPDTYATLNYLFVAGLHHFYLGKWVRGLLNISIFFFGILAIVVGFTGIGISIIIATVIFECYELFRSQLLVLDYNNKLMRKLYVELMNLAE